MKRVKCLSGIEGYQCRIQETYSSLADLKLLCEIYGLHKRLGYPSAKDLWEANPIYQGSTNPDDLRVVLDEHNKVEFVRVEVEGIFKKFLEKKISDRLLIGKLNAIDKRLKKMFGGNDKSIWFRTFKGDTMVTTIRNIENYLAGLQGQANLKTFLEGLEIGVNEIGMEVYYS